IPPTQLVDRSYPAYISRQRAVSPESHQRSWWIVHTQPASAALAVSPESHQRSWRIVHNQPASAGTATSLRNPTNAVGGSFITSLHQPPARHLSGIPPPQLVDRSYPDCIGRH